MAPRAQAALADRVAQVVVDPDPGLGHDIFEATAGDRVSDILPLPALDTDVARLVEDDVAVLGRFDREVHWAIEGDRLNVPAERPEKTRRLALPSAVVAFA